MTTSTLTLPAGATAVGAGAEMRTIHSAFRRELRLAPELLRSVEHGDRIRAGIVGVHLDFVDRFLHHHHTVEDDLLWPKLLQRVSTEIAPVVEMMEDQHHVVADLLRTTVAARRVALRRRPGSRRRAGRGLSCLYAALMEHLEAEEQHVMPLVEVCITARSGRRSARPPSAARRSRTRRACSACSPTTATRTC